jgi:hypothetical protein
MRIAAGVMVIFSAVLSIIIFIGLIIVIAVSGDITQWWWDYIPYTDGTMITGDIITMAVLIPLTIVIGAVSVLQLIGGIFALQSRKWGLALTGSILSLFPSILLGILAIIFTGLTKKEFESS